MLGIPAASDVIQNYGDGPITDTPEIRVWCHPGNGDDYYEIFDSFKDAQEFISNNPNTAEEVPLVAWKGWELNMWGVNDYSEDIKTGWDLVIKYLEHVSKWANDDAKLKGYFTRLIDQIKKQSKNS
jgi:hypothetical protein